MTENELAPGVAVTPAYKTRVAAIAAAKATAALATMASVQAVDKRAEDLGAAPHLLPEPPRTVRATGKPQSPVEVAVMLAETAHTVPESLTALDSDEFSVNWHLAARAVEFFLFEAGRVQIPKHRG